MARRSDRTSAGRVYGGVREIPLTQGAVALIDESDFVLLPQRHRDPGLTNWCLVRDASGTLYAGSRVRVGERYESVLLHRWLVKPPVGVIVDHRDHDGLNCRRQNLRTASPSQSSVNRRLAVSSTGFRGVLRRPNDRFIARVRFQGVEHQSRSFVQPQDAAAEYDRLALAIQGEFAILNFPQGAQQ